MSQIHSLSFDTLSIIFNKLDLRSIARLCLTSSQMSSLCLNESFWNYKYLKEFGEHLPFNTNSNTLSSPFLAYLDAKLNKLRTQLLNIKNKLYSDITIILMNSAGQDDKEQMMLMANEYKSIIDHYLNNYEKEDKGRWEEALIDVDIMNGYPDFLEAVLTDLSVYLSNFNILTIEGQQLFGHYGRGQHDAEIINILSKKIIQRLLLYVNEKEQLDNEINDLEDIQREIQYIQ